LNDLLAQRLGLLDTQPLGSAGWDKLVKLVVFTPVGHEEAVRNAVFPFAVSLGKYDECSYMASGTGTFRPLAGSRPFCGDEGQRASVEESRLEFLVQEDEAAAALRAMRRAHPYEEPACDLYPLLNQGKPQGIGRWGNLSAPLPLGDFANRVKSELGAAGIRVVGPLGSSVRKVAVCGGSGAFLLKEASFKGVDVLVTGDVKYHEARNAEALGVALIDAGHFGTERIAIEGLALFLRDGLIARGLDAEVLTFTGEQDPFSFI
jgi:putative NIF3 family GTP cyclohydrolase 1 type 2